MLLQIADKTFSSRLFTGTGKFSGPEVMEEAILASGSELVTVALRRVETRGGRSDAGEEEREPEGRMNRMSEEGPGRPGERMDERTRTEKGDRADRRDGLLDYLRHPHLRWLPNTSGVRNAKEALFAAELACEALGTNWLKLEIHPDPRWLLPDPVETLLAAEELVRRGFIVLPYIHADPVLCKRLEEVGVAAVMPLGAPIGSSRGLRTADFLEIIISQSRVPVIVDAGIGAPSEAARAMEMGADAVLVNTAIAIAGDPVGMARAFRLAVESGRMAYEAGLAERGPAGAGNGGGAVASSPLTAFLSE